MSIAGNAIHETGACATGGESNVVVASMDGSAREHGHELHGTMNEHVVRGSGREVGRLTERVPACRAGAGSGPVRVPRPYGFIAAS